MKKRITACFILVLILSMVGCSEKHEIKSTVKSDRNTYYEMTDGTWLCNNISYKYRLEITGKLNHAACNTTFVYLSNLENITFEQAWKASGLSSNLNDYFSPEDAVLIEITTQ